MLNSETPKDAGISDTPLCTGYPVNTDLAETLEAGTKKKDNIFYKIGIDADYKSKLEAILSYLTNTFENMVTYRDFSESYSMESFIKEYEEKMINHGNEHSAWSKEGGILIIPFLSEKCRGEKVALSATRDIKSDRYGIDSKLTHSSQDFNETTSYIKDLLENYR